ncbi:S-phase kinase-associated protein 1 [Aphelenchoides avenae]|nr:S-phase kinase-associated protein 1 [Aphelenchus avenae]KAH7709313.1 S-phase kinase-associated protein 1 [Aphelenchus avenae]
MNRASNTANSAALAAAAPKVVCVTSDKKRVTVDVAIMSHSHKFVTMYRNSGMDQKNADFPCEFPVEAEARVFQKVVEWCKEHKGHPDPVIQLLEDGQRKRFHFSDFEKKFLLDGSLEELSEIVTLAKALDIRTLYFYGSQAISIFLNKAVKSRKPQRIRKTILALGIDSSSFDQVISSRQV